MSVSKMAEMTVAKAVEWLTSDKAFGQECYSRKQIAQLIEQQAAEMATAKKNYYDVADCICMESSSVEDLCRQARKLRETIEQQAQEIERMKTREHRMIEYMRDVKNFAFTINEVANNAIEEAEVQE